MKSNTYSFYRAAVWLAVAAVLVGCAAPGKIPAPLIFERSPPDAGAGQLGASPLGPAAETPITPTPRTSAQNTGNLKPPPAQPLSADDASAKNDLTVTIEQMPLPTFIQTMYGGILKLNYSVDASVAARTDLITFRTPRALNPVRLAELTRLLLKSYGVEVQDFGGVLRIVPNTSIASVLPQIRRGRAQPGVPMPLRPIFNYIELDAVRASSILPTLKKVLGEKVQILEDQSNGILLSGTPEDIQVAIEVLSAFDQPNLKGQRSVRVVPRFWAAEEFSRRLTEVLRVEGYAAANTADAASPIVILPIPNLNSVVVFAQTDEILAHVLDWAKELDQLSQVQAGNTLFTYPVRNADAADLASSLNDLISGTSATPTTNTSATSTSGAAPAPAATSRRRGVVVNKSTNSLIFQGGNQEDYRQWLGLLAELDKPAKSALIDVLVAEVVLSDSSSLGFQWTLDRLAASGAIRGVSAGTLSGAGLHLNAFLGGSGLRQLVIDALASSTDARVISNPKIMARNGETANISVGQEVPTVSSQAVTTGASVIGSNSTVVPQTIQYRNTGVILRVRPVIHSGDRIDLDVSQEVSSAIPTITGVTTSPTINNRRVETKLTLRDGATIMLGGLISETSTVSDSGLPFLKDIPYLGALFKNQSRSKDRTELVILLTPYILNDSEEAESITEAYQKTLGDWAKGVRERTRLTRAANPPRPALAAAKAAVPVLALPSKPVLLPTAPVSAALAEPVETPPEVTTSVPVPPAAVLPVPANAASPAKKTPAGKPAPPLAAPPGSGVVNDPALLEELRRAMQR